jgi:hypothetical protein
MMDYQVIERLRCDYGREACHKDLETDRQMWSDLREDMKAGNQASESEAARYLRELFERYPRKG